MRTTVTVLTLLCWAWPAISALADEAALVARWDFGSEETSKLIAHAGVHRDQAGPRPPEFPDFDAGNTAVRFDGSGARYSIADTGPDSPFDFSNGDSVTLEAWVHLSDLQDNENRYVIGKGRTGNAAFSRDNQNWALRVRGIDGTARISFLFATPRQAGDVPDAHWHRWTSAVGFSPLSGWHHIAVSYRFGEPGSIRGWLNGKRIAGNWDMGGATRHAPVVDDDAVWIASALGGNPGNSFRGLLDQVAIHRAALSDELMRGRFRREGPPRVDAVVVTAPPTIDAIPVGRVLVTFREGWSALERWPRSNEKVAPPTYRWVTGAFVVPRLPNRYDEWGIRAAWSAPVIVRAATDISLSPGNYRFLVRARGLSRLWVGEQIVAATPKHAGSSNGHQPVQPVPEPPLPGMRIVGYGNREVEGEFHIDADGVYRVILEAMIGGKNLRPEPGEMCVAIKRPGDATFQLLAAEMGRTAESLDLTDSVWRRVTSDAERELTELDDANRRRAAASQDDFWQRRHALAARWAKMHPAPAVPGASPGQHAIDAFLARRIERALAASQGQSGEEARHFHSNVLPVLRENCFRCHGEKDKGGLRLDSREHLLRGGDSGSPAVTPSQPTKSELIRRIRSEDDDERMPPGDPLNPEQIETLAAWIKSGADWPAPPVDPAQLAVPQRIADAKFLRRAYLDTLGLPPTEEQAQAFLSGTEADKRQRLIDRLLDDDGFADHWVSYWQDVLAENPNILKPSLNNSGPFRWFLYESLRDNKSMDRLVTELIMMRGGRYEGGSAGFAMAADNDAPLAAKAQILGGAFLGMELQCARCHDSPYHSTTQQDLYSLAAMLDRKAVAVPKTSSVPAAFFEKQSRESLIHVTLKPGAPVPATWPFESLCGSKDDAQLDSLLQKPDDPRERLAALITSPDNRRFARVMVNRVWKRLIGAGFVEPVDDWEGRTPSHADLLDWLAHRFVADGYDLKRLARLIMTSEIYQREALGRNLDAAHDARFFTAPDRRRLTAEQIVDSLFHSAGKAMHVEELTFDPDARRPAKTMISLGSPSRAWMFGSLSNERDRPSLALPRAQAVTDVLKAFGWTGSRQNPRTVRESDPNVLQPGTLANSVVTTWITRVSADSGMAQLALDASTPEDVVDRVFLRFLARVPNASERTSCLHTIAPGFDQRRLPPEQVQPAPAPPRLPRVSWSNHLRAEANRIQLNMEQRARAGDPPDPRLESSWRERYEDVIWSVINNPEFVWVP